MEEKFCPLLSINGEDMGWCQGTACAWWVPPIGKQEGHCAIRDLGALPIIASEASKL